VKYCGKKLRHSNRLVGEYERKLSLVARINERNIGYCLIPKAASTTLSLIMLHANGFIKTMTNATSGYLRSGDERINKECDSFDKHCVLKYRKLASMHPSYNFIFTREPINRLYSCWKDKIYKREGHQYYYEKANKKIFLSEGVLSPPMSSIDAWDTGLRANFSSFLTWITIGRNAFSDEHWAPMVRNCNPCSVNYDLIGHLESLNDDLETLNDELNVKIDPKDLEIGLKNVNGHSTTNSSYPSIATFMADLTLEIRLKLLRIYKNDYIAFSYEIPSYLKN